MPEPSVTVTFPDGMQVVLDLEDFPLVLEVRTTRGEKTYRLHLHMDGSHVKSMTLT